MPIVSKPASIEKNTVAVFTLDKTVLANVASVVADSYFSDMLNWSEVLIYYKSSEGNQREILKFDAIMASPTANFLVSEFARDIFEVQKIVIKDFDNGSFVVQRSELVAAEFDVDMSVVAEPTLFAQESASSVLFGISPFTNYTGQAIQYTPTINITGFEFYIESVTDGTPSTEAYVNLRNDSNASIATSTTINLGASASGWYRVDFPGGVNISHSLWSYVYFEIKVANCTNVLIKGEFSDVIGNSFAKDNFTNAPWDLAFKVYGN